ELRLVHRRKLRPCALRERDRSDARQLLVPRRGDRRRLDGRELREEQHRRRALLWRSGLGVPRDHDPCDEQRLSLRGRPPGRCPLTCYDPPMPEFIFTMKDLRKTVPPKREILKGIWLAFFYGAKIGVLGHNGAGKSSLLRIMAGGGTDFSREAVPPQGSKGGVPPQGPAPEPEKTGPGNGGGGVAGAGGGGGRGGGGGGSTGRAGSATTPSGRSSPSRWSPRRWSGSWRSSRRCRTRSRRRAPGSWTARSRWRWTRSGARPPTRRCR